jgi:predicted P-loop ATPase
MPYGDPEKQKLYQKLYYEKYNKKPTTKRGGKLRIDLVKYKGKPLGKVRNLTLNHYSKPLEFYTDFGKVNRDTNGNIIDFLDVKKSSKKLKKELEGGNRIKAVEFYEIEKDIPRSIKNMTELELYAGIEENDLEEDVVDEIIDYCNELYGMKKSRRKLEYAYYCMLK